MGFFAPKLSEISMNYINIVSNAYKNFSERCNINFDVVPWLQFFSIYTDLISNSTPSRIRQNGQIFVHVQ